MKRAATRLLLALAPLVALSACRAPSPPLRLIDKTVPENARVKVSASLTGRPGDYLATITLQNESDDSFTIAPGIFSLEDASGGPLFFFSWAYFGGARYTPEQPRPLLSHLTMQGQVRWISRTHAVAHLLRVNLDGDEYTFRFSEGGGGRAGGGPRVVTEEPAAAPERGADEEPPPPGDEK